MAKNETVEKPSEGNKKQSGQTQSKPSAFDPVGFFQETREELTKVVWPSRQQLISESVSVVLMVILSATTIYFVDTFFGWAAGKVFG